MFQCRYIDVMKFFLSSLLLLIISSSVLQARHVILCGGPALRVWEDLRVEKQQHDRWWANFVRASTIRIDELREVYGAGAKVVWIVYKEGYVKRGREDGKPYTKWIQEQATKRGVTLKWISTGSQAISIINSQPSRSIRSFDFFGHSNKNCFMLDYGAEIMAASKSWIHEKDLRKLKSSVFAKGAACQSYGCFTGESMSAYWKSATGVPLIGAIGKTDYIPVGKGKLPSINGAWTM